MPDGVRARARAHAHSHAHGSVPARAQAVSGVRSACGRRRTVAEGTVGRLNGGRGGAVATARCDVAKHDAHTSRQRRIIGRPLARHHARPLRPGGHGRRLARSIAGETRSGGRASRSGGRASRSGGRARPPRALRRAQPRRVGVRHGDRAQLLLHPRGPPPQRLAFLRTAGRHGRALDVRRVAL